MSENGTRRRRTPTDKVPVIPDFVDVPEEPGISVNGQVMPAIVFVKSPDGSVQYSLQGVTPLEAPTVVEVGLRALRRDLGLAPLGG